MAKDMQKTVSKFEQYFINKGIDIGKDKGRVEGESKTMLKFIQIRRNRHLSEQQILKDLQSDFELDEATARQYMQAKLVNA